MARWSDCGMRRAFCTGVLAATTVAAGVIANAQSNVYSLGIFHGGTSYNDYCSFHLPFPPERFSMSQRAWFEDSRGLHIMNPGHEKEQGGILQRVLDVECGKEHFHVRLDPCPPGGEAWCGAKEHTVLALLIVTGDADDRTVLAALLDGSVGLYSSNGGRITHDGENLEVNAAARKLVANAAEIWAGGELTTVFSTPQPAHVRFYLITSMEIVTREVSEKDSPTGSTRHRGRFEMRRI